MLPVLGMIVPSVWCWRELYEANWKGCGREIMNLWSEKTGSKCTDFAYEVFATPF